MAQLLWDASSLAKRYVPELGSATVDALFAAMPGVSMVCTVLGYAETAAVLRRRFNQGALSLIEFRNARLLLEREMLDPSGTTMLSVDDVAFLAGITLGDQYDLNASDAAIMRSTSAMSR